MRDFFEVCRGLAPGSTVLLRVDFNLSRDSAGQWILNKRLYRVIPVIKELLAMQFGVVLVSHLGRPREGVWEERFSLASLGVCLESLLGKPVTFLSSWPYQKTYLAAGTVALAENTRFLKGESSNCSDLAGKMVEHVDLVVMEAFACSHRSHASTVGVMQHGRRVCLGPEHRKELRGIDAFLTMKSPRVAYIGGKKISTKLPLLVKLLDTVDKICFGGGIASTILYAKGYPMGTSWVEFNCLDEVDRFCRLADSRGVDLILPVDACVTDDLVEFNNRRTVDVDEILPHESVVDIGPRTISQYTGFAMSARSVYWNGPMGIYEHRSGIHGSAELARSLSTADAYSLVGGGDTLSALTLLGIEDFSHLSTGGGAFLHYLAHNSTPVLDQVSAVQDEVAVV